MNPREPAIMTPKKLIFTINDTSSRDGFVVTCSSRLVESMNSLKFIYWFITECANFLDWNEWRVILTLN